MNLKGSAQRILAWAKKHPIPTAIILLVVVGAGVVVYLRNRKTSAGSQTVDQAPVTQPGTTTPVETPIIPTPAQPAPGPAPSPGTPTPTPPPDSYVTYPYPLPGNAQIYDTLPLAPINDVYNQVSAPNPRDALATWKPFELSGDQLQKAINEVAASYQAGDITRQEANVEVSMFGNYPDAAAKQLSAALSGAQTESSKTAAVPTKTSKPVSAASKVVQVKHGNTVPALTNAQARNVAKSAGLTGREAAKAAQDYKNQMKGLS